MQTRGHSPLSLSRYLLAPVCVLICALRDSFVSKTFTIADDPYPVQELWG